VAGLPAHELLQAPHATLVPADGAMQWIFSDGLASVSLFVAAV
jgi:hypothetical protein